MTVNLKTRHQLGHPSDKLIAALVDPDFHDAKVRHVGESGSTLLSFDHNADTGRLVVRCRQRIDRDDLPSIARRFARDPVFADREEVWRLSTTWSSAEFVVDVPDAPMDSGGRLSLLADGGDSCTLTTRTYIRVSAPLMSRSIERAMADNVRNWLDDEQRFTRGWLADH